MTQPVPAGYAQYAFQLLNQQRNKKLPFQDVWIVPWQLCIVIRKSEAFYKFLNYIMKGNDSMISNFLKVSFGAGHLEFVVLNPFYMEALHIREGGLLYQEFQMFASIKNDCRMLKRVSKYCGRHSDKQERQAPICRVENRSESKEPLVLFVCMRAERQHGFTSADTLRLCKEKNPSMATRGRYRDAARVNLARERGQKSGFRVATVDRELSDCILHWVKDLSAPRRVIPDFVWNVRHVCMDFIWMHEGWINQGGGPYGKHFFLSFLPLIHPFLLEDGTVRLPASQVMARLLDSYWDHVAPLFTLALVSRGEECRENPLYQVSLDLDLQFLGKEKQAKDYMEERSVAELASLTTFKGVLDRYDKDFTFVSFVLSKI
jgi:hypothetical protein